MAINMHQQVYVVFLVLIGIMYDIPYLIFFFPGLAMFTE